jgi:hypothetical protein
MGGLACCLPSKISLKPATHRLGVFALCHAHQGRRRRRQLLGGEEEMLPCSPSPTIQNELFAGFEVYHLWLTKSGLEGRSVEEQLSIEHAD